MLHIKKILYTAHPQHEILALAMVGIGLILICNDYYFFWPPFAGARICLWLDFLK